MPWISYGGREPEGRKGHPSVSLACLKSGLTVIQRCLSYSGFQWTDVLICLLCEMITKKKKLHLTFNIDDSMLQMLGMLSFEKKRIYNLVFKKQTTFY